MPERASMTEFSAFNLKSGTVRRAEGNFGRRS